jgi:hypothetical protein
MLYNMETIHLSANELATSNEFTHLFVSFQTFLVHVCPLRSLGLHMSHAFMIPFEVMARNLINWCKIKIFFACSVAPCSLVES